MKTLTSGWCPKHDRVFEKLNRCPECGTALVPVGMARKPATPDEHRSVVDPDVEEPAPVARNPWIIRLGAAGALGSAFVLGLAFPSIDREAPQPGPMEALRERSPATPIAQAPNGNIRMVSMTQSDERVTAVFRAISGFADPRLMGDAAVEVSTSGTRGAGSPTFSLSETRVVANAEGFTITGRLDLPGDIVELRIVSVQVRDPRTPEWRADVSSIWPVGDEQPTVLHVTNQQRAVHGGSVSLTALLGWSDRLEAVFDLRDVQGAPGTRSGIVGFDMLISPAGATGNVEGRAITAIQTEQVSAGQVLARFESVPANAGVVVIRATDLLNFVEGPWIWRLS